MNDKNDDFNLGRSINISVWNDGSQIDEKDGKIKLKMNAKLEKI